jgi:hypothetical protein
MTLAEYHTILDKTDADFTYADVAPVPDDIMRWGR